MQFLMNLVVIVQILTALVMIGLVLVQHGKGADMGAAFGSGASGTLFGATGSANVLSRATSVCATLFFVCTLALAYFAANAGKLQTKPGLLDAATPSASAPAAAASVPAGIVTPAGPAASNP